MTTLFLLICAVSVMFFILFFLQCSLASGKSRRNSKAPAVHKLSGSPVVDSLGGRRFFAHIEEQMAEFISAHGRTAAGLMLIVAALPLVLHAQGAAVSSTEQQASAADQQIPPAVAKQLEAMQKRIDQLEQALNARTPQSLPITSKATAPVHLTGDQAAPATVPVESALAQQAPKTDKPEPFSFADFSWLNGNSRIKEVPFDTKFFTPEIRVDANYTYDFHHPKDDTIGGSSEIFRSEEFQVTQMGVGGDFHYDNVQARIMTQFGLYSTTTPRNDASPARGQWQLDNAYRYISEAYGGYHINALDGINIQAGIFMSYVGLFSYYQFDNWAYQPSYVSSNTPWFFNGMRVQIYPNEHLKIEPWLINGWQSYGRFNNRPGIGGQILWRPNGWFSFVGNQYALGEDALGNPGRVRYHTDDSIQVKYYQNPDRLMDMAAFSLTGDMGCEHGGGVSCAGDSAKGPKQSFLGYMIYNRLWFHKDIYALTLGGGQINNPGRYLVLLPPINGATAASGTPYFTENPGDPFKAWDVSATVDYMPSQYITFRMEYNHRASNVPYFSGSGGITPSGGNTGSPGSLVPGFTPDLVKNENRMTGALLVMF
ncbi:MAG: outer membrane beta-barrel protein [Candidatus Korobacteraceae bacterium]